MTNTKTTPDVDVTDHGSVVLFHLETRRACDWVNVNVGGDGAMYHGNALCVEPRYAQGLICGMEEGGLTVATPRMN